MYVMIVDHPTTKRRKITLIMTRQNELVWSGAGFNEAMEWLYENGHRESWVEIDLGFRKLHFGQLLDKLPVRTQ